MVCEFHSQAFVEIEFCSGQFVRRQRSGSFGNRGTISSDVMLHITHDVVRRLRDSRDHEEIELNDNVPEGRLQLLNEVPRLR